MRAGNKVGILRAVNEAHSSDDDLSEMASSDVESLVDHAQLGLAANHSSGSKRGSSPRCIVKLQVKYEEAI